MRGRGWPDRTVRSAQARQGLFGSAGGAARRCLDRGARLSQALTAGDFPLALKAAAALDKAGALPADGQLLFLSGRSEARIGRQPTPRSMLAKDGSFDFVVPVLRAWVAQAGKQGDPFAILDAPTGSALTSALARSSER